MRRWYPKGTLRKAELLIRRPPCGIVKTTFPLSPSGALMTMKWTLLHVHAIFLFFLGFSSSSAFAQFPVLSPWRQFLVRYYECVSLWGKAWQQLLFSSSSPNKLEDPPFSWYIFWSTWKDCIAKLRLQWRIWIDFLFRDHSIAEHWFRVLLQMGAVTIRVCYFIWPFSAPTINF